jgi:hypothetical protein
MECPVASRPFQFISRDLQTSFGRLKIPVCARLLASLRWREECHIERSHTFIGLGSYSTYGVRGFTLQFCECRQVSARNE